MLTILLLWLYPFIDILCINIHILLIFSSSLVLSWLMMAFPFSSCFSCWICTPFSNDLSSKGFNSINKFKVSSSLFMSRSSRCFSSSSLTSLRFYSHTNSIMFNLATIPLHLVKRLLVWLPPLFSLVFSIFLAREKSFLFDSTSEKLSNLVLRTFLHLFPQLCFERFSSQMSQIISCNTYIHTWIFIFKNMRFLRLLC